jgi:hypothetical protein
MFFLSGRIVNFNKEAYELFEFFDNWLKEHLAFSALVHVDETDINTGGIRNWLHNASNDRCSYFYPHAKRGGAALDEMGILPNYQGILCHDQGSAESVGVFQVDGRHKDILPHPKLSFNLQKTRPNHL